MIVNTLGSLAYRKRVFCPLVTVWSFLQQVLGPDASCRAMVAKILAHRLENGEQPCSPRTGGFVQARKRLPRDVFQKISRWITGEVERKAEDSNKWLWRGRHVKIVDGTGLTCADTRRTDPSTP